MPSIENFLWLYCCAHNDFCKRGCPITEYELSGGPILDRLLVLMNWTTFLAKRLDIPITYFQCNSSPPKNSYSVGYMDDIFCKPIVCATIPVL